MRTKELVRQLVCTLTCLFVPRPANERRFVPLRLGTLWARHNVDMTVQVRALSVPRTYARATAQKLLSHPAGKTLTSARACEAPRRCVSPSCRRGSARQGGGAGGVDRLRHPTLPAPVSLQPQSISSRWRYQRHDSGDIEWRRDRGRYEGECVAHR